MSAPNKRSNNEDGSRSSSPLKRPLEEATGGGFGSREVADKRSSSLLNRMSPYLDHSTTTSSSKDAARDVKAEGSREITRSEFRDLCAPDPRINHPPVIVRAEGEVRGDNRRDPNDFKSEGKVEKDGYTSLSSHVNWRDYIELHTSDKRYSESLADNLDSSLPLSWHAFPHRVEHGFPKTAEVASWREWDSLEGPREAVGENKVDVKGERKKEQNDREMMDTAGKGKSPRPNEKDNIWHHDKDGSEPKRHKDDNWKASDRDSKDKKRARDVASGERHEQHDKHFHKEPDDGSAEGEGAAERDREAFGNGVQQRRRMLLTRGSPQTPHREPQFPSTAPDNDGSQGKHEVSTVVYKAGDCMQELLKAWKEFEASQETKNDETSQNYRTLEIRIPAEYVTSSNRQVRGAQLWGTDIYTNDSDLFAVLMHTGYCRPTSSPPDAIQELRATVRVLPPQEYYTSTLRNNVRSRAWGAGIGCSFRVERCCIVKKGGGTIDLEPRLTHISALEPTLAPVSVERTMTTRSAASNALRQQKFVREVSIQYNLCNEPWLKYIISVVADKGMKKPLYTSARLKKGEVMYLETHSKRYELCYNGGRAAARAQELEQEEKRQNHCSHVQNGERNLAECENTVDVFRWSCCKKILPEEILLSTGIPLRAEDLEIIEDDLEWEDLQWSQTGVLVAGKSYALARVHFLAPKKK